MSLRCTLGAPKIFPEVIERLRRRAETLSTSPYSVLRKLYRSGHDSVGWHNEPWPWKLSGNRQLSLGGSWFQLRHRRTKHMITVNLKMGVCLIMAGQTQRFG
jgi:alkylated DNA repair dioxygenase AlkB